MIAAARRKWFALALLLGVQFMVVLDLHMGAQTMRCAELDVISVIHPDHGRDDRLR